jgi:macrodomain Ter protein organizer (MatP/YcbG family)
LDYIERKLNNNWMWPDCDNHHNARDMFDNLKRDPLTLQQWCDQFLNPNQWQQLKNAIRSHRRQNNSQKDDNKNYKSMKLKWRAHMILSDLAIRDRLTLSDTIEKYLMPHWKSSAKQ